MTTQAEHSPWLRPAQHRQHNRILAGLAGTAVLLSLSAVPAVAASDHDFRVEPSISADHVQIKVKGQQTGLRTVEAHWDPAAAQLAAPGQDSPTPSSTRRTLESSSAETDVAARVLFSVDKANVIRGRAVLHSDTRVMDPATGQVPLQWSESNTAVSLGWWKPASSGAINWHVDRDGQALTTTSGTSFVDRSAAARKVTHVYTVKGTEYVTVNGAKEPKPYFYQVAVPATDASTLGKKVTDPTVRAATSNTDIGRAAAAQSASSLTYNAFIPVKYADAPAFCPENFFGNTVYYGGDNRGFSDGTKNVSSRLSETVGQSFIGGSFYDNPVIKKTGDTTAYDLYHDLLAKKNAGTSGITVTNKEHTSKFVEQTLRFHVKNPLCISSTAIDARTYYMAQADGNMRIEGSHDQAPSHEATFYFENDDRYIPGRCAYRFTNKGFKYLLPELPNATFDISWNPNTLSYPKC